MPWLLIAKGVLVVFLVISVAVIAVVYRRRSKRLRWDPPLRPDPRRAYFGRPGGYAATPLPEWAYEQTGLIDPEEQ